MASDRWRSRLRRRWREFFLLAALDLETASHCKPARRYGHRGWNRKRVETFNRGSSRVASVKRQRDGAAFRGLRCAIGYGPVLASSHRPMMPRYSFGDGTCVGDSFLIRNSQFFIPPPLPWHHRSTPSMAPGRSCADRAWIGVPSASCSSFEPMAARAGTSSRSGSVGTFTQCSAAWWSLSLRSRAMRGGFSGCANWLLTFAELATSTPLLRLPVRGA